jgi:hypothetical protein
MRALLATLPLLFLAACGDDAPPSGSGMKVKVNGQTIDVGGMQEASKRAMEMVNRPLTAADVERFLAVMPEVRRLGSGRDEDTSKILEKRGVFLAEWGPLVGRVMAAYQVLKHSPGSADAKVKADAEVVRPYVDRIEAVMNAK